MANEKKGGLSFLQLGEYGSGMFAMSFNQIIISYYYLFFLTNIKGMNTALAGTLYTASTFIKIVAMLVPGTFIDKGFKKTGTYRTWYFIGSLGCFLFTGLMFLNLNVSDAVYFVYSVIMIFLGNVFYNLAWISSRSVIGKMARSTEDTTALVVAADWGTRIAGLMTGYAMVWAINAFANNNQQYMFAEYCMSIFMLVVLPVFMHVTKPFEVGVEEAAPAAEKKAAPAEKSDRGDIMRSFTRPAIMYYLSSTFGCAQVSVFAPLMIYYTTYVLNNPDAMALANTMYSIGGFVGLFITPWLRKRFTNRNLYGWITLFTSVIYMTLLVIKDNGTLFIVNRTIVGIISVPTSPVMVALATDVSDWNEMKGISKARGFVTSMMGVCIRLGLLLASTAVSVGLTAAGYDASKGAPDEKTLKVILMFMAFGPAVCCVLCWLFMMLYNVDEKELSEWRLKKAAGEI